MRKRKNLEDLLYWQPLKGLPDSNVKIYCAFEVGGAYETWGYVCEVDGEIFASGKNVEDLLHKVASREFHEKETKGVGY